MPENVVTLLLTVDLGCCTCRAQIQKVLCKLQRCEPIHAILYDEANDTVVVSGTFYPECLSKKLLCKARRVIKDIKIKPEEKEEVKKEDKKPDQKEENKSDQKTEETDKPKEDTPPPTTTVLEVSLHWPREPPAWASGCCCRPCPCYQARQGCCRCCSCGKIVSAAPRAPYYYPVPLPLYGSGRGWHCDEGVKIMCEEDAPYNACNVM